VSASAKAMAQFCMVELGQDAAAERRVVNAVKVRTVSRLGAQEGWGGELPWRPVPIQFEDTSLPFHLRRHFEGMSFQVRGCLVAIELKREGSVAKFHFWRRS
jgi:hypothetical protein